MIGWNGNTLVAVATDGRQISGCVALAVERLRKFDDQPEKNGDELVFRSGRESDWHGVVRVNVRTGAYEIDGRGDPARFIREALIHLPSDYNDTIAARGGENSYFVPYLDARSWAGRVTDARKLVHALAAGGFAVLPHLRGTARLRNEHGMVTVHPDGRFFIRAASADDSYRIARFILSERAPGRQPFDQATTQRAFGHFVVAPAASSPAAPANGTDLTPPAPSGALPVPAHFVAGPNGTRVVPAQGFRLTGQPTSPASPVPVPGRPASPRIPSVWKRPADKWRVGVPAPPLT